MINNILKRFKYFSLLRVYNMGYWLCVKKNLGKCHNFMYLHLIGHYAIIRLSWDGLEGCVYWPYFHNNHTHYFLFLLVKHVIF